MKFNKFNIEYNKKCNKKDYLSAEPVAKYNKSVLCGSNVKKTFKLKSKAQQMIIKFYSNAKTTKPGFKATIVVV